MYARSAVQKSVYEQLRSDILAGELPPSSPVSEAALAEKYGTSRTPIREALQRLQNDQLVERTTRGMQIKATTPEEILDIYEVRVTLEGAAARGAARRHTAFDMARLKAAQEAMRSIENGEDRQRAEANRAFHEALWSASHSPTLVDLLGRLSIHLHRYPTTTLSYTNRWDVVLREHDELLEAIAAGDADRAARIAEEHMSGARDVRLQMYATEATGP